MTDGEDHEEGIAGAIQKAKDIGMKVFTIGLGSPEGELIQVRNPQTGKLDFLKDDGGNVVKSRLNESLLRQLSTETGAFYLPMQGADTIERLYASGLAGLTPSRVENQMTKRYIERFQWPLGFAILLLFVEMLLRKFIDPLENEPLPPQQRLCCSCVVHDNRRRQPGGGAPADGSGNFAAHSTPMSSYFQKLTTTPRSGRACTTTPAPPPTRPRSTTRPRQTFVRRSTSPRHPCPYSNARFITSATRCFGSARKPRIRMIKSSSGPER